MDKIHARAVIPVVQSILLLVLSANPFFPEGALRNTETHGAQVSSNAQEQFFSGLRSVFSEDNLLDKIGWNTPRFGINVAIIFVVLAVIVFLIILMLQRTVRARLESMNRSANLFNDNKVRCALSDEEAGLLESMVSRRNIAEPHVVFQSISLFEQCVAAEIDEFLGSRPSQELVEAKDLLLSELRRKLGFQHLPLEHPLMSTRNISVGQTGSLFSKDSNRPIFRTVSVVQNTSVLFSLAYDVEKEKITRVAAGQKVRFAFARQNDGLYGAQVAVFRSDKAGTLDLLHTLEMKRNQLRQYVRIETSLPVRFRLVKTQDPEKSEVPLGELLTAKMSDISGGGLSFLFDRSLRLGDLLALSFDLPGTSCAGITGKIVHLSLREAKGATLFKNHVQFEAIESRKREKIISYVFEKERQISQWR